MAKLLFEELKLFGSQIRVLLSIFFQSAVDTFAPMPAAFEQIDGGDLALPGILDGFPTIGRGRLRLIADSGWKLLLPLGFLINGRQKIGNCRFIRQFH